MKRKEFGMQERVNQAFGRFRELQEQLSGGQSEAVPKLIEQCRLIHGVHRAVAKGWEAHCEDELGFNKRVARRYDFIGQKWAEGDDRTPGSELMAKLPASVGKLEALCKLEPEQLNQLAEEKDLRVMERSEIFEAVKRLTGKARPSGASEEIRISGFRDRWDKVVARVVADVAKVHDEDRELVAGKLNSFLSRLHRAMEKVLSRQPAASGAVAAEEPEGSAEADHEEAVPGAEAEAETAAPQPVGQVEASAPAPVAPKADRPAAQRRPGQKAA
jgi:hypothetical protein